MRIAFVSNFFNHHQKYLSDHLNRFSDGNYHFIAGSVIDDERVKLGYQSNYSEGYILYPYLSEGAEAEAQAFIDDADTVIIGSAKESYIQNRLKNGRLVFRYSERPLKNGLEPMKYLPRLYRWRKNNPVNKEIYLLCSSAYSAYDYSRFGLFRNKAYKWGYFPKTIQYDIERLLFEKQNNSLLWCGRLVPWKHPEYALYTADKLRNEGYDFVLNFIGIGEMEAQLKASVESLSLQNYVHFLGSMPPEEVRRKMEQSQIFLFTSGNREGWGAVLNEAMNSGCAVVASDEAGSVPYLIKNKVNGMIYDNRQPYQLFEHVKALLEHQEASEALGLKAYETIVNLWNAEVAAERFINLSAHILSGERSPDLYEDGPCSKANIIKDGWFKYEAENNKTMVRAFCGK